MKKNIEVFKGDYLILIRPENSSFFFFRSTLNQQFNNNETIYRKTFVETMFSLYQYKEVLNQTNSVKLRPNLSTVEVTSNHVKYVFDQSTYGLFRAVFSIIGQILFSACKSYDIELVFTA